MRLSPTSIPPSLSLWSLQLEQIRAKWSYQVSPPLTTVYRRDGAEQPFNKAEWGVPLCSATFPTFLPRFATVPVARKKTRGKEGKNDGRIVANNSWKEGERDDDTLRIRNIYSIKPLASTTEKLKLELLTKATLCTFWVTGKSHSLDSNPEPPRQGPSRYTWGGRSTNWANQHPISGNFNDLSLFSCCPSFIFLFWLN